MVDSGCRRNNPACAAAGSVLHGSNAATNPRPSRLRILRSPERDGCRFVSMDLRLRIGPSKRPGAAPSELRTVPAASDRGKVQPAAPDGASDLGFTLALRPGRSRSSPVPGKLRSRCAGPWQVARFRATSVRRRRRHPALAARLRQLVDAPGRARGCRPGSAPRRSTTGAAGRTGTDTAACAKNTSPASISTPWLRAHAATARRHRPRPARAPRSTRRPAAARTRSPAAARAAPAPPAPGAAASPG